MCRKVPDKEMIRQMYDEAGTPCNIVAHMQAVADYQDKLLDDLEAADVFFDREIMRAAALLHDIKRLEKNHAAASAKYLADKGYPEVAALIEGHHSPADSGVPSGELSAADILFYADKRVQGSKIVSIAERFEASAKKCTGKEAMQKHDALLDRAKAIEEMISSAITKKKAAQAEQQSDTR